MDRKSILLLVVCFVVLMLWYPFLNRVYPPKPMPRGTNSLAGATNQVESLTNRVESLTNQVEPLTNRGVTPSLYATPTNAPAPARQAPAVAEELLVLTNGFARYTFTSHGGGIKRIELVKHLEALGNVGPNDSPDTNFAALNNHAPSPVMGLRDGYALEGDGVFTLIKIPNGVGVRAEKRLTNGLEVVKEFRLVTNYLMEASISLKNTTTNPMAIPAQEWIVGTATPLNPWDKNTLMLGAITYNGVKAEYVGDSWFANRTLGCIPGVPRTSYASGSNMVWAAVHNQFFALAVIPQAPAPQVVAQKVDLPAPSSLEAANDTRLMAKPIGYEADLVYPASILQPQQNLERRYQIYAGPKEYNTLARFGAQMGNNLDYIMNFGGFFGFFAKLLLLSMNALNAIGLGYGLAIIVITVIIKLVFWPLTRASTRSMKRMSALQPQMKALQEKYKADPKKMNMKLMEFMKEHKVSPVSGCFPMLLQIPVFFGFYTMLQSAIELRGAHFLWAMDLSTSDTIGKIAGFPVNPLPLMMGVTMLWQARMTPPSPGMDPVQQKVMKYMPLMFMVFLYNFSAGLTLYWTVQNLLTIAQMKLTKNDSTGTDVARKPAAPTPGAFGSRKPKI